MIRDFIQENRRVVIAAGIALVVMTASGVVVTRSLCGAAPPVVQEHPLSARVSRVYDGATAKINDGEKIIYAGIRPPYADERLFEEAKRRNAELVEGKEIQLRFDPADRNKKKRLNAYVFVNREFVNEILVREGLAYVRLTPQTQRFADQLLAAQREARAARRGLWQGDVANPESSYPADLKYGNFHRPGCEEVQKIKPERRQDFLTANEAAEVGLAPCPKCRAW